MTQARLTFGASPNYLSQPLPGRVQILGPNQSAGGGGGGGGGSTQPGYDGIIQVFGGKLCNGNNVPIILRGASLQGPDYVSISGGTNPWDFGGGNNPGPPNFPLYKTFGWNCVRIMMSCCSWLGDTIYDINSSGNGWGPGRAADPGNNFQQTMIDAIAGAQKYGMYVVIDAQGNAPDLTFGGVTHHLSCGASCAVGDVNTLRFWQSIAAMFGTQATPPTSSVGPINNAGIMFDLLNEPHPSYNGGPYKSGAGGTGSTLTGDQVILNGGYCGSWPYVNTSANGGGSGTISQWQPVVGYQQMVNAIRATGAQNICCLEGDKYCRILSTGLSYKPTDPFNQIIFSLHGYAQNGGISYPETGPYVYCETDEADGSSGTSNCLHWAQALVTAGYPVIMGEDGGYAGVGCHSGEPHMTWVLSQLTAGALSGYLVFAANPVYVNPGGSDVQSLYTIGTGLTTNPNDAVPGQGQVFITYTAALPP